MARGRMTIGLYNSYDPARFAEAHRRAIARAAPIALAFDANLATFGFPFERDLRTPVDIAAWISGTTSIGEAGTYLRDLARAGRFRTFAFPKRGFPPQLRSEERRVGKECRDRWGRYGDRKKEEDA